MASPSLIASLTKDIADGLRVWRTRDHVPLTDHQILERTRNIVANIVGNYFVAELPAEPVNAPTWAALETATDPPGTFRHHYGCCCGACPRADVDRAVRMIVESDRTGLLTPRTERPLGVVDYHGWSCMCDRCADAKQRDGGPASQRRADAFQRHVTGECSEGCSFCETQRSRL